MQPNTEFTSGDLENAFFIPPHGEVEFNPDRFDPSGYPSVETIGDGNSTFAYLLYESEDGELGGALGNPSAAHSEVPAGAKLTGVLSSTEDGPASFTEDVVRILHSDDEVNVIGEEDMIILEPVSNDGTRGELMGEGILNSRGLLLHPAAEPLPSHDRAWRVRGVITEDTRLLTWGASARRQRHLIDLSVVNSVAETTSDQLLLHSHLRYSGTQLSSQINADSVLSVYSQIWNTRAEYDDGMNRLKTQELSATSVAGIEQELLEGNPQVRIALRGVAALQTDMSFVRAEKPVDKEDAA